MIHDITPQISLPPEPSQNKEKVPFLFPTAARICVCVCVFFSPPLDPRIIMCVSVHGNPGVITVSLFYPSKSFKFCPMTPVRINIVKLHDRLMPHCLRNGSSLTHSAGLTLKLPPELADVFFFFKCHFESFMPHKV